MKIRKLRLIVDTTLNLITLSDKKRQELIHDNQKHFRQKSLHIKQILET